MDNETIMNDIHSELWALGITANYTGFFHASYAIFLAVTQPDCLLFVTKSLYPTVAKQHQTSATAVERNIRTVIDVVWNQCPDALKRVAGYNMRKKPTISQFVSILAYRIAHGQSQQNSAKSVGMVNALSGIRSSPNI